MLPLRFRRHPSERQPRTTLPNELTDRPTGRRTSAGKRQVRAGRCGIRGIRRRLPRLCVCSLPCVGRRAVETFCCKGSAAAFIGARDCPPRPLVMVAERARVRPAGPPLPAAIRGWKPGSPSAQTTRLRCPAAHHARFQCGSAQRTAAIRRAWLPALSRGSQARRRARSTSTACFAREVDASCLLFPTASGLSPRRSACVQPKRHRGLLPTSLETETRSSAHTQQSVPACAVGDAGRRVPLGWLAAEAL